MNDFATLLMRLELSETPLERWESAPLDVESYQPADGGDGGLITQAIVEGTIDELPGTVGELLEYLDAPEDGWTVERSEDAVNVHVDGLAGGDDPQITAVRGAVASQLFAHAIETAGAAGYLYLLDFYLEDELPSTARLTGGGDVLERHDLADADPQDRMDFVERVRERLRTTQTSWPVADDRDA